MAKDIGLDFMDSVKVLISKDLGCKPEEVYVVWFAKELQNIKGMFSSDVPESKGIYYEATYNGGKEELYIDRYKKEWNKKLDIKF